MDRPTSTGTNKLTDYDKLQQILDKVRDLKQSLAIFFAECEHGQPSWPTILSRMNVLLSEIVQLRSIIRTMLPLLRMNSIIPMCLSPDPDPNVEQLTERRLPVFNHDIMPQLLRTKNLPEIEERERVLNSASVLTNPNASFSRPNPVPNEIQARIQELNTSLNSIGDIFNQTKQSTERGDRHFFESQRFNHPGENKQLLEAMNYGTGLKAPNTSSSPITTNDQANLSAQMPAAPQRQQTPSFRIKTLPKPNRS